MRWIWLLLLLGLMGAIAKNGCHVREFYAIGYTAHNPIKRHTDMLAWLERNALYFKTEDYVMIKNNLSEWAGTSDTVQLRGAVIKGYTDALEREKK